MHFALPTSKQDLKFLLEGYWYGPSYAICKREVRTVLEGITEEEKKKVNEVFFDYVGGGNGYCKLDEIGYKTLRGFLDSPPMFEDGTIMRGNPKNSDFFYYYENRYNQETNTRLTRVVVLDKEKRVCDVFYTTHGILMQHGVKEAAASLFDRTLNG